MLFECCSCSLLSRLEAINIANPREYQAITGSNEEEGHDGQDASDD